jgi:4-methyl-5(b-hydroxyethyl)-thiazole monophosphate biosynthesis
MAKSVLCVVTNGFEEIEMVTPVDVMRRAGIDVVIASLNEGPVKGRSGLRIEADAVLGDLDVGSFDVLFLPGGPQVKALREDGRAALLAADFLEAGKPIAAICAAPLVLHDAGVLKWHRFTSHDSTWGELPEAVDERVVVDNLIITSRGAGTALDFGLALVGVLAGDEAVAEVSAAIMA